MDEHQGLLTLSVAAPYVTRVAAELTSDYKDRYSQQALSLLLLASKDTAPGVCAGLQYLYSLCKLAA